MMSRCCTLDSLIRDNHCLLALQTTCEHLYGYRSVLPASCYMWHSHLFMSLVCWGVLKETDKGHLWTDATDCRSKRSPSTTVKVAPGGTMFILLLYSAKRGSLPLSLLSRGTWKLTTRNLTWSECWGGLMFSDQHHGQRHGSAHHRGVCVDQSPQCLDIKLPCFSKLILLYPRVLLRMRHVFLRKSAWLCSRK